VGGDCFIHGCIFYSFVYRSNKTPRRIRIKRLLRLTNSSLLVGNTPPPPRNRRHIHPQTILDGIHGRMLPRSGGGRFATGLTAVRFVLSLSAWEFDVQSHLCRFGVGALYFVDVLFVDIGTFSESYHCQVEKGL